MAPVCAVALRAQRFIARGDFAFLRIFLADQLRRLPAHLLALVLQPLNLRARILDFRLRLLLFGNKRRTLVFSLLNDLREFADALFQCRHLLLERRRQLLIRRERHLAFGQRRIRLIAVRAQIFEFVGQRDNLLLRVALTCFQVV